MKRTPGTFYNHGDKTEYIALSRVADVVGVSAHVIGAALSEGSLPVKEISGCKCVALADLFRFQEGAK